MEDVGISDSLHSVAIAQRIVVRDALCMDDAHPISNGMKHIGDLVGSLEKSKERKTERGELMRYFRTHLNAGRAKDGLPLISMPRMGFILQGIPTKDLYYLKSVCDQAKHWSKKFWWEIDPKKHMEENPF